MRPFKHSSTQICSSPADSMDSSSLEGIELGKLVLSSGLLQTSWKKISEDNTVNQDSTLRFKIHKEEKFTIVVFTAPTLSRHISAPTTLPKSQDPNPFQFLKSEKFPSFSVHTPALELFASAYNENLPALKSKLFELLKSKKPLIITGAELGGAVASLFTLWLLEKIDPKLKLKRPLCITFGSPLIGDASLQQILENSVRSSCFLHVADAAKTPITAGFKPIGTFLICFESECICIDDPDAVMELLKDGVNTDKVDYGVVLHRLDKSVFSMGLDTSLVPDNVTSGMKKRAEDKKQRYDPSKELNRVKVLMVYMERYKRKSKELKTGYYDQYRSKNQSEVSIRIQGYKKELNLYWKSLVEEVAKKPQSDVEFLSRRFLFSGNNYRRLIEPLDIAEYYREGGRDYRSSVKSGESSHYVMLKKWFEDAEVEAERSKSTNLSDLLTFDSCFWAEVEEAVIVLNKRKEVEGMRDVLLDEKLVKFEEYVWEMIGKRAVSPEIFLEKSSFMTWWKDYNKIKDGSSHFTEFMNCEKYKDYGHCIAA